MKYKAYFVVVIVVLACAACQFRPDNSKVLAKGSKITMDSIEPIEIATSDKIPKNLMQVNISNSFEPASLRERIPSHSRPPSAGTDYAAALAATVGRWLCP